MLGSHVVNYAKGSDAEVSAFLTKYGSALAQNNSAILILTGFNILFSGLTLTTGGNGVLESRGSVQEAQKKERNQALVLPIILDFSVIPNGTQISEK